MLNATKYYNLPLLEYFQHSRSFLQYPEPPIHDLEAEEAIDDETYGAILKRLLTYSRNDSLSKLSTDPFYFAGAATKLSETTAKGMVPFPKMYNKRTAIAGGTSSKYPLGPTVGFSSRARPTGTKRGYSKAPYPNMDLENNNDYYNISDIINQDLDDNHVDLIKKMVNLIHLEQEQQKVSSQGNNYK